MKKCEKKIEHSRAKCDFLEKAVDLKAFHQQPNQTQSEYLQHYCTSVGLMGFTCLNKGGLNITF